MGLILNIGWGAMVIVCRRSEVSRFYMRSIKIRALPVARSAHLADHTAQALSAKLADGIRFYR